jgi:hypothetical protein
MPLIRLDVPVSLPAESWPKAVDVIYEALRSAFGVPENDRGAGRLTLQGQRQGT